MNRNEIRNNILIHGNGFAQLILDKKGEERMHVWDQRIPRQIVDTNIHNHRFDFVSCCMQGAIISVGLEFVHTELENATYRLYTTAPHGIGETNILIPTEQVGFFHATKTKLATKGQTYCWQAEDFHVSSFLGTTVTLIRKTKTIPERAKIACVIDEVPDNGFNRSHQHIEDWLVDIFEKYI